MKANPVASSELTFFQRLRGWIRAMSPYIAATISLRRPLKNAKLRREIRIAPPGIDEYFSLDINGHPQWLRIRGRQPTNPVLLYLHGGPGGSQIPSYRYFQLKWEHHFTVVHWEQRGAGKSFSRNLHRDDMTVAQLVLDALRVIDYLAERFSTRKIVLLGHSWGSFLGIHVLHASTRNIGAYVGVGQVSNLVESERRAYRFALEKASADHNARALSELQSIDPYPGKSRDHLKMNTVRRWVRHYGFLGSNSADVGRTYNRLMDTPEYGLIDIYRFLWGTLLSTYTLGATMALDESLQPSALPNMFDVPFFVVSGRRDHFTSTDMADEYFQAVRAPVGKHIIFESSGHYPHEDESTRFLSTLLELTGPYV